MDRLSIAGPLALALLLGPLVLAGLLAPFFISLDRLSSQGRLPPLFLFAFRLYRLFRRAAYPPLLYRLGLLVLAGPLALV